MASKADKLQMDVNRLERVALEQSTQLGRCWAILQAIRTNEQTSPPMQKVITDFLTKEGLPRNDPTKKAALKVAK